MSSVVENISHAAQRQAFSVLADGFLKHLDKTEDRTATYMKLVDEAAKFYGDGADKSKLDAARKALQQLSIELEQLSQGPLPKASALSTRQAARIDTKVKALVAAIAPLNT